MSMIGAYPSGLVYQEDVPPLHKWDKYAESRSCIKLKPGLWMWFDTDASNESSNLNVFATALVTAAFGKHTRNVFGRIFLADGVNINNARFAPVALSVRQYDILIEFFRHAGPIHRGESLHEVSIL